MKTAEIKHGGSLTAVEFTHVHNLSTGSYLGSLENCTRITHEEEV